MVGDRGQHIEQDACFCILEDMRLNSAPLLALSLMSRGADETGSNASVHICAKLTGLIISTKTPTYRKDGIILKSSFNRVVLLSAENLQFLGTRIYGPI